MENSLVSLTTQGNVARLALKRPPLNLLSREMLLQIETCLSGLGDPPPCQVLILEAEGNAFSCGLDASEEERSNVFLQLEQFHRVIRLLDGFPSLTLGLARGMALGAGNELLAFCDLVYAAETASFGHPEIKVGAIPSLAPLILPLLVGQRRALRMIVTGEIVEAPEAVRIGLIDRAVPESELGKAADQFVTSLADLSRPVLELALREARGHRRRVIESHLRESEAVYLNELCELEDAEEGARAFRERRRPQWKHR